MPYLGIENRPFAEEVRTFSAENVGKCDDDELEEILKPKAKAARIQVLGFGGQSFVYTSNRHPKVLEAVDFFDRTSSNIEIFYLHRAFNRLFPHNIPNMHALFTPYDIKGDSAIPGTKRQLIERSSTCEVVYPFSDVYKACKDWNLPLWTDVPECSENFVVGPDCGEYYVDLLFEPFHKNVNLEDIKKFMKAQLIADEAQHVVLSSFKRYLTFPDPDPDLELNDN